MNYAEILEKVKEYYKEDVAEFGYSGKGNVQDAGPFEEVFSKGGEDEGSDWRRVKLFKDHNVFIEVSTMYTSYEGADFESGWDCCKEVSPKEKTITVYE